VVEETDKIKQHIDEERENLGRNLDEIEFRFKDATDLKAHFARNTGWFMGAAVAGGLLLSLAFRKSPTSGSADTDWVPDAKGPGAIKRAASSRFVSTHLNQVSETVDHIVAGLVGVFADKLQSFVAEAVPGFQDQYNGAKQRGRSSVEPMRSRSEG